MVSGGEKRRKEEGGEGRGKDRGGREGGRKEGEEGGKEETVTQVCCAWWGFFLTSPVEIQPFLSLLLLDSLVEKSHCFTEMPPPEDKTHITQNCRII